jgi:hypothetical protein
MHRCSVPVVLMAIVSMGLALTPYRLRPHEQLGSDTSFVVTIARAPFLACEGSIFTREVPRGALLGMTNSTFGAFRNWET